MAKVEQRPNNEVKTITSIEKNLNSLTKYKNIQDFFDIKDIAGIRITCHCEDDLDNFTTLLEGELRQKYRNVKTKEIGGKGKEYP